MIETIILETLKFIAVIPFEENLVFPLLIIGVFIVSLLLSKRKNIQSFNEYKEDMDTLIYDEYKEPIASNATSGILMSIGIIGTFYLIYASLHHLSGSIEIQNMLDVITNNIAPAFSISALGITSSIFYILFEKFFILEPYRRKMKNLREDSSIITYVSIEREQIEISKKSLHAIEQQTETFKSLNSFSKSLEEASEGMKMFGEIAITLEETLNPKVLGEVISTALMQQMKPILDNVSEMTQEVNKNSENINENSKQIKDFLEKDLKNEIITPLKDSVDNTTKSMKNIESALDRTSEAMSKTNEGFDKLNSSLDKLENSQDKFVKNLDGVLDKQRKEFERTTDTITQTYRKLTNIVLTQTNKFEENSNIILESFTELSSEMKDFLIGYKEDYKELLTNQEKAIKKTSEKSVEILEKSGEVVSKTIIDASDKLQSTLDGVDEALVKTSQSIKEELTEFKNSYTDTLKDFLGSQEKILDDVFKKQTERLSSVVTDFRENLEKDVSNRKILNEDLEKLVKTTNGFVASTQAMITTAFDEQQNQITSFMQNNQSMQSKLSSMIDNATNINENGNKLTRELIENTGNLQKQFNDNQIEILKKYQIEVDKHLKDILGYMATVIEASHIEKVKD